MALEVIKVIAAGRITKDIDLKTLPSGTAIASFSIAVGREYTAKGQEKQTDFFNVKAFSKTAEFISKYFRKGSAIYIEGSLQTSNWTDKNGQKHYATDIVADKVKFVESANRGGNSNEGYAPSAYGETASTAKFEQIDADSSLPF